MLTRNELAQLSDEDRVAMLDQLAGAIFRTQEDAAEALDVGRTTYLRWKRDKTVPLMALMSLQLLAVAPDTQSALAIDAKAAAAELGEAAAKLAKAAQLFGAIVKRLP